MLSGGTNRERLDSIVGEIQAVGGEAEGFLVEIARAEDALTALRGNLDFDIFVCAFGPFLQKPLDATEIDEWDRIVHLNLAFPGALASALLPGMISRGWGRLVFFGGTGTDVIKSSRTNAAYAAAKTGLGVLAKSIAVEYAHRNVAAFVVCPGLVDTDYLSSGTRGELAAKSPRGILLSADDIGETIASMAAADPCLASGAILGLDGGLGFRK